MREEAAISLVQNHARHVYVRLPETGNIGDKELTAQQMPAKGEVFDLPAYIAPLSDGRVERDGVRLGQCRGLYHPVLPLNCL